MESTPCKNRCSLFEKARCCQGYCYKQFGHIGECLCNIQKENHLCSHKCHLCEDFCNKALYHTDEHLCGRKHPCNHLCEESGYCQISIAVKLEETRSGSNIFYEKVQSVSAIKNRCNKFYNHSGIHSCGAYAHKCGFRCKQCDYYCCESYGHNGLHKCLHGKIKNLPAYFSDGDFKKDKNEFSCDEFCRIQGQGHIHYFESDNKIFNCEVKLIKENNNKYIYECECSYYWKNILMFEKSFR